MQQQAKSKSSTSVSEQDQQGIQVSAAVLNHLGQDASLALNVIATKTGLSQGSWQQFPPVAISPGASGEFTVTGGLGGSIGHAVYDVIVNGVSQGQALLSFSVPGPNPDSDGVGISLPPGVVGEAKIMTNSPKLVTLAYTFGVETL